MGGLEVGELRVAIGRWRGRVRASGQGLGQFGQVVGGADQGPFEPHLVQAAEQELAKASGLFDLAEHRLDDLFPQSIAAAETAAAETGAHRLQPRPLLAIPTGGGRLSVALPAGGDVGADALRSARVSRFASEAVAGIGRDLLRLACPVLARMAATSGVSWAWSLPLSVRPWATMIWSPPSTAAWAL